MLGDWWTDYLNRPILGELLGLTLAFLVGWVISKIKERHDHNDKT